jgi:hypothetical protein
MIWVDSSAQGWSYYPLLYGLEALTLERLHVLVSLDRFHGRRPARRRLFRRSCPCAHDRQCIDSKYDQYRSPDRPMVWVVEP